MNWIQENLQNALDAWNGKLAEVWSLLSQSPETFKGGDVWAVILDIHDAVKAIGFALLVLFFVMGVIKTCGSFADVKRPEVAVKMLLRFVLAKAAVSYSLDIMLVLIKVVQGIIANITGAAGAALGTSLTLPTEIVDAINSVGFLDSIPLWIVAILASLLVTVLSFVVLLTVYNRFFKVYFHVALAPIPLAAFAGEPTSAIGVTFLKSLAAACLEGAIVIVACVIFTVFATSPPALSSGNAVNMVWAYIAELIFNLLVLVGAVRLADQTVKGMFGL